MRAGHQRDLTQADLRLASADAHPRLCVFALEYVWFLGVMLLPRFRAKRRNVRWLLARNDGAFVDKPLEGVAGIYGA
jgi:hypothetical protein